MTSRVSGCQLRAARGLLRISGEDLSRMSDVSWATIQRFESEDNIPNSRSGTLDRVIGALEDAGIEFIGDSIESPGVRLRRKI